MTEPTSAHVARYRPESHGGEDDGRLRSPVFDRVSPVFLTSMAPWLGRRGGTVLEIGAGTGQQATASALAFPALRWVASDPDPVHRRSIAAWAAALKAPLGGPLDIDASADWAGLPEVAALGPLDAVVSMNVIHIAPMAVARGILAGAGRVLAPGGLCVFYGPFVVGGRMIGPGNAAFDARLRAENPDWGLRDVAEIEEIGAEAGLGFAALLAMPANNRILILQKTL